MKSFPWKSCKFKYSTIDKRGKWPYNDSIIEVRHRGALVFTGTRGDWKEKLSHFDSYESWLKSRVIG